MSGKGNQRLVWNAGEDLGEVFYKEGITVSVECVGVVPGDNTGLAFEDGKVFSTITRLDTRSVHEVVLGERMEIYADIGWFAGANELEVFVNGMPAFATTHEDYYSFSIGKRQLNIWGINTLKLTADNGIEQTARIKYPDFVFTATQGNRDSIILEWNRLKGIHTYSVCRRIANTGDEFVEVAHVSDTTRWADTSEETVIGEFEYTIMPLLDFDEDAGPQPAAVTGYRALDIARPVTITPAENGTLTADKETAKYGETVTLTVTSDKDYELDQLSVSDDKTEIDVLKTQEGLYTFIMPASNVAVSAMFKAKTGVATDTIPYKLFRDGLFYILHGDRTYIFTGAQVK